MERKINERPYQMYGSSYAEFLDWCKKNNKKHYRRESKTEYFKLLREGMIN